MSKLNRRFQRYHTHVPNIKIVCLDLDNSFNQSKVEIIDISLGGCCLRTPVEFEKGNFVIRIGKRRIKILGKAVWSKETINGILTGVKILFEDTQSYDHWTQLLHTLNTVERHEDAFEFLHELDDQNLQFLPQISSPS